MLKGIGCGVGEANCMRRLSARRTSQGDGKVFLGKLITLKIISNPTKVGQ
ncbi:hypothetical protein J1TS5_10400 [Paenibacillus macerans]|nr:hypothetical protein J1TS5_10400 [Paenibacillus macerans]